MHTIYVETNHLCTFFLIGFNPVTLLFSRAQNLYIQIRQSVNNNCWPPNQLKEFIPLVLIQYQSQNTMKLAITLAELYQSDHIHEIVSAASNDQPTKYGRVDSCEPLGKVIKTNKVTQDISEILAPLEDNDTPQFILIQGAPGIGKSFLLEEIAYRWGNGQLLQGFKLLLLVCLRDPFIKELKSISELLQSVLCTGDSNAKEAIAACNDYLFKNSGKDLVFLFDGYDELSQHLQQESLVAKILNRKVLPSCGIVVSSRPHASVYLQEVANVRLDIIGFTETDRKKYIQKALTGQPKKIEELTQYLDCHLSINSLCLVPFNMTVLIFLYKYEDTLPKNSTELYDHFVRLTICRNVSTSDKALIKTIPDLRKLPEPYSKIVNQLAKLSLQYLNINKLTFTQGELETACPDIKTISEDINGFGLLQAIKHFRSTGEMMTFNFVHLSIQEFLAAYYIAQLPPADELKILKEKFWSIYHFNVFAFYVALTNGQHSSFKEFLSGKDDSTAISDEFLTDQLKCFRLFKCFYEAGDMNMCHCIEEAKTFHYRRNKRIDLTDNRFLSVNNLECVALFMTHSVHKQWDQGINFYRCYIQDQGIRILHHRLVGSGITIRKLWLDCNGLTSSSSSLLSDIVVKCKVKELCIDGNETVGEDKNFSGMLSDSSSELEKLYMSYVKLSSAGAIRLFTALATGNKLKVLRITFNDITDEACGTIAATLKDNTSLIKLNLGSNPISAASAQHIIKALQHNNTLKELTLPDYTEDSRSTFVTLAETINKIRTLNECKTRLYVKFW